MLTASSSDVQGEGHVSLASAGVYLNPAPFTDILTLLILVQQPIKGQNIQRRPGMLANGICPSLCPFDEPDSSHVPECKADFALG